jgi:Domain of unknown function (DUF4157)/A nuclease of the HNH/ENDO VII superfamily with conserved WHH
MKAGLRAAPKAPEAAKGRAAPARPFAGLGLSAPQAQPQLGNQAIQQLLRSGALHAKLAVGSPDDPLEKEADAVAERVTRAPAPTLRRKCACGGPAGANGECDECRDGRTDEAGGAPVLRRRAAGGEGSSEAPPIVHETLGGGGRPLDPATRADMEGRFGADFGDVRIHTGRDAARSAEAVGALAYTVGRDIAFGEGRYAPQSDGGRKLLAHELAHVAQQGPGVEGAVRRQPATSSAPTPGADSSGGPTPAPGPSPTPPTPGAASTSVVYDGQALSPVESGAPLSPDPARIHQLVGQMIAEHGEAAMRSWVTGLDAWLAEAERWTSPDANQTDISGAPPAAIAHSPESIGAVRQIVAIFRSEQDVWRQSLQDVVARFEDDLIGKVGKLLDQNRDQVLDEAARYGIAVNGPQPLEIPGLQLPPALSGPSRERGGARDAARDLVALWQHQLEARRMAESLLTPPWGLIELEQNFHEQRRNLISEYPILAAYARDLDDLRAFASADDPTEALRIKINQTLMNIAVARAGVRDHMLPAMIKDPGLRADGKRDIGVTANSPEDRAIDDAAAAAVAAEEAAAQLKEALSFALLIASFIPGVAPIAGVIGLGMGALDVYDSFQNYLWEEAASGSAFDKALAISQSDPSLFRLGAEIAVGVAVGVATGAAIGGAINLFKVLAPIVREAIAARVAAAAGEASLAETADAAMAHLREAAGPELGNRIQAAIERGEFGQAEGGAVRKAGPGEPGIHQEITGIPDAFGGESHTLRAGDRGIERCSISCPIFAESLKSRADHIDRVPDVSDAMRGRAATLRDRAAAISSEALEIVDLPEDVRSKREATLLDRARAVELEMVVLEHEVLGFSSIILPESGQWRDLLGQPGTPGNSIWYPPPGSRAAAITGGQGIPYHNGFPNFTQWQLPGSEVSLLNMTGRGMGDFAAADTIAGARTGMTQRQFQQWRLDNGYTWHHRENAISMQLVPTALHASVPHLGGAWVSRGIPLL